MADHRLGIAMTGPFSEPTPAAAAIAKEAENLGYSSLWVAEFAGPDAILTLAYHALHTSRVMLGTGVLPIQIRTPGVMGMAFLTLNEISGGRAVAGIGVSSPGLVETSHGASYRKPVTAMREYVQILRQFFNEGRAKFEGQVYRTNLRLQMHLTQKQRPRIYMAALNPPMVKLAGELADGVLFNFCPPEMVADRIAIVRSAAAAAGRNPDDVDIAMYAFMYVMENRAAALENMKRFLSNYAFLPNYSRMFSTFGFGEELEEVRQMVKAGKRDTAFQAISDASAYRLAAFGSFDTGREWIARCRAAGVTHPIVWALGETGTKQFGEMVRAMAGA
jgi:alkanesulfonate monooxygenase SsuD/methylene tetrahydromethanopterin reductase-like flavin-dependent oxidoreductase (luciferase family)